jgi:hypothetical protein
MGEKARQVGSEVTSVAMAVVNAIVVNAVIRAPWALLF